jgi:GT2 family glycosyltransferase
MRLAWVHAIKKRTDFFLWLNDDLVIFPGSLDWLIETYEKSSSEDGRLIVVGKVISLNGETSYGGLVRASALSRLRFRSLHDGERCCDTMNGNCVLIPERAVSDIGINSNRFTHAFGDIDYGLRARRCDYRILEHSDAVGVQERGVAYSKPSSMSAGGIWKFLTSPKGMPMNEWYYFCRQYGGWLWPVNFISMYIKPFFSSIQRPGSNP